MKVKTKKTKFFMAGLLSVASLAMVGSITGTMAWYQYSTRVSASYVGTTVTSTENLQISVDNGTTWGTEVTPNDIAKGSGKDFGSAISPITTGAQKKDEELGNFYANPTNPGTSAEYVPYTQWKIADKSAYMQFELQFKLTQVDGKDTRFKADKALYLTDLTIEDATTDLDLSSAVRVQLHSEYGENKDDFLFAKEALENDATELETYGALDLNGDGVDDKAGYLFSSETDEDGNVVDNRKDRIYGAADATDKPVQSFYTQETDPEFFADASSTSLKATYTDKEGKTVDCTPVGYVPGTETSADDGILSIKVTIWVEGWAALKTAEVNDNQVWDAETYLNNSFNVGMTFGVLDFEADSD